MRETRTIQVEVLVDPGDESLTRAINPNHVSPYCSWCRLPGDWPAQSNCTKHQWCLADERAKAKMHQLAGMMASA